MLEALAVLDPMTAAQAAAHVSHPPNVSDVAAILRAGAPSVVREIPPYSAAPVLPRDYFDALVARISEARAALHAAFGDDPPRPGPGRGPKQSAEDAARWDHAVRWLYAATPGVIRAEAVALSETPAGRDELRALATTLLHSVVWRASQTLRCSLPRRPPELPTPEQWAEEKRQEAEWQASLRCPSPVAADRPSDQDATATGAPGTPAHGRHMPHPLQTPADVSTAVSALRALLTLLSGSPLTHPHVSAAWDGFRVAFGCGSGTEEVSVDSLDMTDRNGLKELIRGSAFLNDDTRDALVEVVELIDGVNAALLHKSRDEQADDKPIREAKRHLRATIGLLPLFAAPPLGQQPGEGTTQIGPGTPAEALKPADEQARKKRKIPLAEARVLVRDYLLRNATPDPFVITIRQAANATGVSTGQFVNIPEWVAFEARRKALKGNGEIPTVPLTSEMLAEIPGGDANPGDEALAELIRQEAITKLEQEQQTDDRADDRAARRKRSSSAHERWRCNSALES